MPALCRNDVVWSILLTPFPRLGMEKQIKCYWLQGTKSKLESVTGKAPVFTGWSLAIIIQTFFTITAILLPKKERFGVPCIPSAPEHPGVFCGLRVFFFLLLFLEAVALVRKSRNVHVVLFVPIIVEKNLGRPL